MSIDYQQFSEQAKWLGLKLRATKSKDTINKSYMTYEVTCPYCNKIFLVELFDDHIFDDHNINYEE